MLRRPGNDSKWLSGMLERSFPPDVVERAEVEVKYEGYIRRQVAEAERLARLEGMRIPSEIDFGKINGLSTEIVEKLSRVRPQTFAEAAKIDGITPAALSVLAMWISTKFHVKQGGLDA